MSVLCLVPAAQRAARAARRLCEAQDGVLLDVRVTTPEAAAALILAAGESRPVLSPLAEALLSAEVAGGVPLFAGAEPGSGTIQAVRSCIAELRRAEVEPEHLRAAARDLPGPPASRLRSLAEVLEAYQERLAARGALDGASALRAAAERVALRSPVDALRDLDLLVVDGFTTLSPAALDLALGLTRRARRAEWRVPYCPGRADLSGIAEPLVRRLESLHHVGHERVDLLLDDLDGNGARTPTIVRALRGVFGGDAGAGAASDGRILLAAGAGEEGEAELAAGVLSRLLDDGFAPDDVALLAASRDAADRVCRAALSLHLPLNGRPRRVLAEEPPIVAVLGAIDAAAHGGRSALERVLTSPYLALARTPARLGFWLDRAGARDERGDPGGMLRRRAEALTAPRAAPERGALLRAADALDQAVTELARVGGAGVAREHAARLRGFVARTGVRRHAARADPDVSRPDLEALARLDDVAEDLVRALTLIGREGEVLAADRWGSLLALAAGQVTLSPPSDAAVGIEVSPVANAPGLSARAVVVVGCARGAFPEPPRRDPLLGDAERLAVNATLRRPALATAASLALEARHAAFGALATARERLCVTWPGPGADGPGRGPAPVVLELAAFGESAAATTKAFAPGARSEAEVIRNAALRYRRTAAAGPGGAATAPPGSLLGGSSSSLEARLASALDRAAVEAERRRSVDARVASRFSGAIPGALLPAFRDLLPRQWTPSQLEEHAVCPFRFFVGTVLHADEPPSVTPDIEPRDEGSVAHAVLERFYRDRIAAGRPRLVGAPGEREELVTAARAVFAAFEADGRTGDPAVWASRRGVVLRRLESVIEQEAARGDDAVPVLVEHRFGGEGGAPPLAFRDGTVEVQLRGRIDRVDATADRLVVIDYKDTRAGTRWREKLQRDALGQVNFQIPAYLMAAARALPGRERLEATYLLLRSAERLAPFAASAGDALFAVTDDARARARAGGERPFADAVVAAVSSIRGGALPIASRDCGGCPFGAVCRFPSRAEEEP